VADAEEDIKALLLGAAAMNSEPLSFLLPVRQANVLHWCLSEGFRAVPADDIDGDRQISGT